MAHHCLLAPEHAARRLVLAEELLRVSSVTGRPVDALLGLVWRTVDLFLAADPRAERSLSELRAMLTEHDHGAVRFVASAVEVMLDLRAGRFEAAEAAPALGVVEIGFFAALAVAAAAAGDRRAAAGALARLQGRRLADLPRSSGWLVAMYGAAEAADLLQDREVAGEAYELLAPFAERPMTASLAVTCFGSTHHALGVASLTVSEHARAVEHFQSAVRANQALGHWPAAAVPAGNHDAHRSRRSNLFHPVPPALPASARPRWAIQWEATRAPQADRRLGRPRMAR